MKKHFTKIKIAAENLGRSNKHDQNDAQLDLIEKQVERYREVLDKMVKKLPVVANSTDAQEREKRIKKNSHYKIGQALEECCKELTPDMPLQQVLQNCAELEKSLAESLVKKEIETETKVVMRLKSILDTEIQDISKLKRNLTRTIQDYGSISRSYEASRRLDEPQSKLEQLKSQQEQLEIKLEKDKDLWAAKMFDMIAKEHVIVDCIKNYVLTQRNYQEEALYKVNTSLAAIHDISENTIKSRFGTSLTEHLNSAKREICYIIEMCVCCLVENGLDEEGILRVGCSKSKLRRLMGALEARQIKTPLPQEYQDPHVIGSILKLYLRELPEPILTYRLHRDFTQAASKEYESDCKAAIKTVLSKLPQANYTNLRYLTRFLWLVTQHADHNKMTSQNLAIVMAPNLIWIDIDNTNYLGQINTSTTANRIVELLIREWDYFFAGEVDFFLTLERGKLYERKSKSNSSNENLEKSDGGDSTGKPGYGTLRRTKACAPSPPASKMFDKSLKNGITAHSPQQHEHGVYIHRNDEGNLRAKELFPANNVNHIISEFDKPPEKPPLPKLFKGQPIQIQDATQIEHNSQKLQEQQHEQQHPNIQIETTPKPVPKTRTQFFGLDNLPSPTADRRSMDGTHLVKPDVPQKPKVPKRPAVLGLNPFATGKSDDDDTPTGTEMPCNIIEKIHAEYCDKSANKSVEKINQRNSLNLDQHSNNINRNSIKMDNIDITVTRLNEKGDTIKTGVNEKVVDIDVDDNQLHLENGTDMSISNNNLNTETQSTLLPVNENNTLSESVVSTRVGVTTPTTPLSPTSAAAISQNSIHNTPKRPTIPAPPPPMKKQTE